MEFEYGDWKDWLLCFGAIVLLEVWLPQMASKKLRDRRPRYWRRHPEEIPSTSPPNPSMPKRIVEAVVFIIVHIWAWPGVLLASGVLFGAAVNAMYSDDYIGAAVLFFMCTVILISKALSSPEIRTQENRRAIATVIVVVSAFLFGCSLAWDRHVYKSKSVSTKVAASIATNLGIPEPNQIKVDAIKYLSEISMYGVQEMPSPPPNLHWDIRVIDAQNRNMHVGYEKQHADHLLLVAAIFGDKAFNSLPKKKGQRAVEEMRRTLIQLGVHYDLLQFPLPPNATVISIDLPITSTLRADLQKNVDKLFGAIADMRSLAQDATGK